MRPGPLTAADRGLQVYKVHLARRRMHGPVWAIAARTGHVFMYTLGYPTRMQLDDALDAILMIEEVPHVA